MHVKLLKVNYYHCLKCLFIAGILCWREIERACIHFKNTKNLHNSIFLSSSRWIFIYRTTSLYAKDANQTFVLQPYAHQNEILQTPVSGIYVLLSAAFAAGVGSVSTSVCHCRGFAKWCVLPRFVPLGWAWDRPLWIFLREGQVWCSDGRL